MLAISSSPLMSSTNNGEDQMGGALLDVDISFDDLFVGFDDGDILPDLEIDSDDIFADFSFSSGEEDTSAVAVAVAVVDSSQVIADSDGNVAEISYSYNKVEDKDEEDLSRHNDEVDISATCKEEDGKSAASASGGEKIRSGRKTSTCKGSHGKKKAKVDWTPELHRRFVQAVEQLGVDKAVPSRILELMGIDCLTRHNIASHLQKYRCHRKHLLARETEAASWSQRRQMYSGSIMKRAAMAHPNILGLGLGLVKNINPTTPCKNILGNCFPPLPPPPPHHHHHHQMQMPMPSGAALIRPLHVWGHPPSMQVDRPQLVPLWPRHLSPPPWIPLRPNINGPPIPDPMTYWPPPLSHSHKALAQGTPCYPPQLVPTMRFQAPPIPPHALFRPSQSQISSGGGATTVNSHYSSNSQPHHLDTHPSNEKIDAAIEDVLAKPWSPLPLGLKPPSLESVMVELQRQGVSNVPPTYSSG